MLTQGGMARALMERDILPWNNWGASLQPPKIAIDEGLRQDNQNLFSPGESKPVSIGLS